MHAAERADFPQQKLCYVMVGSSLQDSGQVLQRCCQLSVHTQHPHALSFPSIHRRPLCEVSNAIYVLLVNCAAISLMLDCRVEVNGVVLVFQGIL